MALHDMPDGHARFARYRYRRFVASAPRSQSQAPLLQGIVHLEKFLGRLHQQSADGTTTMALERAAAFIVTALFHRGIQTEVSRQFSRAGKTLDLADGRDQSVKSDEIDPAKARQSQQLFVRQDLLRHIVTKALTPDPRSD